MECGDHYLVGEVLMPQFRKCLLGACLALPLAGLAGAAVAASPGCGAQPLNGVTVFLPSPGSVSVMDAQAARLIADTNAMFRRIDAEMNAMQAQMETLAAFPFQFPSAGQLVPAGFAATPWTGAAPGNGVVFTSVSTGSGTCSETITYSTPSRGGRPIVHVSQHGNACGTISVNGPARVQAAQPVTPRATTPTGPAAARPRLWQAMYRRPVAGERG